MKEYNRAIVLGLGVSGLSAAKLLISEGSAVTVVDAGDNDLLTTRKAELSVAGAEVILACTELPADKFDICIVSPGISASSEWVKELELRMPVISELELGASRCLCPIVAVTGSNGKSTMVKLCGDAMTLSGLAVEVAGNYGTPVCEIVRLSASLDWIVLEVSSFQLERVVEFAPKIAVLLNVQPDHLDRHGSLDRYRNEKLRIFQRTSDADVGIVLSAEIEGAIDSTEGNRLWLSFGLGERADYQYQPGRIVWSEAEREQAIVLVGSYFDNSILGLTAAASVAVLRCCEVPSDIIQTAIRDFAPLAHRMEGIGIIDGVRYINDSKATNLTAMLAGVNMAGRNVRLIAGGQLKEKSSTKVKEVLAKSVKSIYLIGEASEDLNHAWSGAVDCTECSVLSEAVCRARNDASEGDIILLSPGCASFDQFKNYKDRGDQFKEIVKKEI